MNTLFPLEPVFPEGFQYFPDFISEEEEQLLLRSAKETKVHSMIFHGYTANRKVASFGFDYSFTNRKLTRGNEIPAEFDLIINKVAEELSLHPADFAELLVTEYPPASVINWHRDAPPFDIIAGISLLSDCIFRLRPQEKAKQTRNNVISFPVKRRSLYVMKGPSRSEWQHSIAPVKETRYSITLRTLKKEQ
jgi:alkylated DNA repair dioxygenase AlkB